METNLEKKKVTGNMELTVAKKNKKIVTTYLQELVGDKDITAIDRYVSDELKQHDPIVGDGKKPLKDLFTSWYKNAPKKSKFEYERIAADGDLVFIHFKAISFNGKPSEIVDIFRLKDGKVVEHWGVTQSVPDKSMN